MPSRRPHSGCASDLGAIYRREQDRLTAVRSLVVDAERKLAQLQSDPPTIDDLAETRVDALLATGDFAGRTLAP